MSKNILFWFRNDLRLNDNQALIEASKKGNIIPVYVFNEANAENYPIGYRKIGNKRAQFITESVNSLKSDLQKLGSDLIVKIGNPGIEIAELAHKLNCSEVFASKAVTQQETNKEAELSLLLKPKNIDLTLIWNSTLYHVKDLPFQVSALPTVFSEFRKQIERRTKVRNAEGVLTEQNFVKINELEKTKNLDLKSLGYNEEKIIFKGGENEANKELNKFIWESDGLKNYSNTRNNFDGKNFSSHISPWLSIGSISPRQIYEQILKFEEINGNSKSTEDFKMELLWRDYFYFVALKFGIRLFKQSGIKHDMNQNWRNDKEEFEAWINGNTGIPIIDACMRELKATGYISNRARLIACSFFVRDLKLTWWWGARYFENALTDYDVCNNWGNWNYLAGIGTDPKEGRYFNPIRQGIKYDPTGEYIRKWVPELANIKDESINQPWEIVDKKNFENYPSPIINIEKLKLKKKRNVI